MQNGDRFANVFASLVSRGLPFFVALRAARRAARGPRNPSYRHYAKRQAAGSWSRR